MPIPFVEITESKEFQITIKIEPETFKISEKTGLLTISNSNISFNKTEFTLNYQQVILHATMSDCVYCQIQLNEDDEELVEMKLFCNDFNEVYELLTKYSSLHKDLCDNEDVENDIGIIQNNLDVSIDAENEYQNTDGKRRRS